jgi:hypothetical protein
MSETFGTIEKTTLPDIAERQLQLFEIADISVSQGPGENPLISVTCYSRAVQQMKRDRSLGLLVAQERSLLKELQKNMGLSFGVKLLPNPRT